MKKPRIPPMLSDLVQMTLTSCDGVLFDQCGVCPHCGGELAGYDIKKKHFAIIMAEEGKRAVEILVKRFLCRSCGQISLADQPFYPDTRIGSPVVDLCLTLGETMPYARVSSCLAEMGIMTDRGSVRNYVLQINRSIPAVDMFGVRVPISIISLSTLAGSIPEGRHIDARALLTACGDPWVKKTPAGSPRGT